MMDYPGFRVLLRRLLDRRRLAPELVVRSGITEPELEAVLDGEAPSPAFLLRLSPVLDLHAADLFSIAQLDCPRELAPLDPRAGRTVPQIVGIAARLSTESLAELRQYVRSLSRRARTRSMRPARVPEQYPPSIGAVLVRMVTNRNLDWSGAARVLSRLADVHLSPATIGAIGHGRKDVSVELLTAFSIMLGVQVGDLAALAAMDEPPTNSEAMRAVSTSMSGLIWDLRDLTADQAKDVHEKVDAWSNSDEG